MDVTASLANGVILNATPARVEVGQKVRFELRFRRPPPPDLNIQYGFNFADGSPVEWTAVPRTTHPYSSLGTYEPSVEIRVGARVLDLPKILGPTVQVVTPSSPTPTSTATSAPITPSPTSTYTPIATAAPTATSFISPTHSAPFAVFENAMALHRRWPRCRFAGVFSISESETEDRRSRHDRRFMRIQIGTLRRGRRKIWPSITGYIFIPIYPLDKTGSKLMEQA